MTPRQGRAGALRWLPGLALAAALAVGPAAHAAPGAQAPGAQPAPRWAEQDIRASRSVPAGAAGEATQPPCQADACQLFVVLEREGRQLALLDGARLEVVARLPAGHPVHGEPRFTPDGRHVFLGSQDGWITKLDLWRQRPVAQVRAGLQLHQLAGSGDGRWVIAALDQPRTLALFDADLQLVRRFEVATLDGRTASRIAALRDAAPRKSFVATLRDVPQLWEISYDPQAAPIYDGLVHDYKLGEAIPKPGYLGVRRTPLRQPLGDFSFEPAYRHVIAAAGAALQVINLDARVMVAELPVAGLPQPGAGAALRWNGAPVLAIPQPRHAALQLLEMQRWRLLPAVPTPAPATFVRSHASTGRAWIGLAAAQGEHDTLALLDGPTLQAVARPAMPGAAAAPVAFTRDGRYVLASLRAEGGDALVVLDARTLQEVRRLPMEQPSGVYGVDGAPGAPSAAASR